MDTTKNKNEKNIVNFNDIGDDKEAIKLETGITILMFKEKRALFGICNKNGELIIQRKNVEKILLFFLDHQNQFVPSDKVKKETRVGHLSKKISYINTLLNPNLSKDGIKIIESGKNEYYGYYRFRVRGGQEK